VQQQHTGVSGPPDDAHTVGQQQQQEEEQPQPGPSQPPPPSQQPPQPQPQPQADGVTAAAAAGEAALTTAQLQGLLYQVPFKAGAGGPDAIYAFPPGTIK
jgi:hypothetical protein